MYTYPIMLEFYPPQQIERMYTSDRMIHITLKIETYYFKEKI